MLSSDRVAIARFAGTQLHAHEIDKKETEPEGWENVSISKSPVSMTNVLAALLFGILRAFVNWATLTVFWFEHILRTREVGVAGAGRPDCELISEERPPIVCKPLALVSSAPVSGLWKGVHR